MNEVKDFYKLIIGQMRGELSGYYKNSYPIEVESSCIPQGLTVKAVVTIIQKARYIRNTVYFTKRYGV